MEYVSTKISDGLGYGDGTISAAALEQQVGIDAFIKTDAIINSAAVLISIDTDDNGQQLDDDGCGDGRKWVKVYTSIDGQEQEFKRSLNRYKVFGGGATMVAASQIGIGDALGKSAQENFKASLAICNEHGINYGAHDDEHANGDNCGCGAIDKNPQVIAAVKKYRDSIYAGCEALGVDIQGLDQVLANYVAYADQIAADKSYKGSAVMADIAAAGKVIKRLGGSHIEARIVINTVEGKTVNQAAVRDETNGKVDVFGVDIPRILALAQKLSPDESQKQLTVVQSMVVYTLGAAAVLTKGDLPIWAVSKS